MTIPKVPNSSQHIVSFPAGAEGAGAKKSRLEEPSAVIVAGDILISTAAAQLARRQFSFVARQKSIVGESVYPLVHGQT